MFLALAGLLLGGPVAPVASPAVDPKKVLDRVDDTFRGDSSHGTLTMEVVTAHFTRDLTLEQWSKGKDRFLVRILAPPKEKDTATLRIGPDVWNYLPRVDRVIKVPSSMMGGAWMGSHVTNDDLVKMSRMADDYAAAVTFDGERDGRKILELTLTPHADAAVVWGKVVVTVDRASLLALQILDYDESGVLSRTTTFTKVEKLGGRDVPSVMTVEPAGAPGEHTRVEWKSLEFDPKIADSFFSLKSLEE